jgi:hypothetical protein
VRCASAVAPESRLSNISRYTKRHEARRLRPNDRGIAQGGDWRRERQNKKKRRKKEGPRWRARDSRLPLTFGNARRRSPAREEASEPLHRVSWCASRHHEDASLVPWLGFVAGGSGHVEAVGPRSSVKTPRFPARADSRSYVGSSREVSDIECRRRSSTLGFAFCHLNDRERELAQVCLASLASHIFPGPRLCCCRYFAYRMSPMQRQRTPTSSRSALFIPMICTRGIIIMHCLSSSPRLSSLHRPAHALDLLHTHP